MKKLVYLLAAGSMAFVACQNSPSYKVTGSVEDITDGDTIYLQEYAGGNLVKLDSAIVKSGTFVFTGKQDTAVNRYITYMKGDKRYFTDLFLENGNINVTLGKESKVSGTPNNDAYQKFKDGFMALSKEMNEMYQKAQSDTSLTEEQVEAIMAEIEKKDSVGMDMVYQTIETIFYGSEEERFYHEAGADMGYMEDTGNHDVRTEGMSYGMMVCVQMNRKQEFDRLWKWVRTYMYIEDGPGKNYFVWSCAVDGTRNADGPAPDGEEYCAMALFFASKRWGDGEGIFNYSSEARAILRECVHKGEPGHPGEPMWNHLSYIMYVNRTGNGRMSVSASNN